MARIFMVPSWGIRFLSGEKRYYDGSHHCYVLTGNINQGPHWSDSEESGKSTLRRQWALALIRLINVPNSP